MLSTDILKTKTKRKLNLSIRSFAAPTITCLLIISAIIFHQRLLVIKEVVCQMASANCPEGVTTLLDHTKGKSFLLLNQKDLRIQVLSTGLVDQVKFIPKLPGKLIIKAEPPSLSFLITSVFSKITPDLTFLTSSTSAAPSIELENYVASMEGKTFQLLSTGVLNQTDGDSNYFLISSSLPSRDYLSKTANWLQSLILSSIRPDAIYILSDMIILKQNGQPDLIMNISSNPTETILALQRINQAITIKKPTVIDFRYSHPILK